MSDYRYVFETPFGRLTSEPKENLSDLKTVTADPDLGRYLHAVQQLQGVVWVTV